MKAITVEPNKPLITRRERPEHFTKALEWKPVDIKVVIQFAESSI
jgi:hypothetical protein